MAIIVGRPDIRGPVAVIARLTKDLLVPIIPYLCLYTAGKEAEQPYGTPKINGPGAIMARPFDLEGSRADMVGPPRSQSPRTGYGRAP